jgi:uncharacterized protein YjeT (DUF2065 family)
MLPGRNRLIVSAVRIVARELGRAGENPQVTGALGKLDPVPAASADHDRFGGRGLAILMHYGLFLALASSVLAFFASAVERVLGDRPFGIFEIAIGVVMAVEGLLAVTNWRGARRLLLLRLHRRAPAPSSIFGAFRWRLIGALLFVIGVVWVAVGAMEIAQGFADAL